MQSRRPTIDDERGVSPVIGVVLLVGIAVISIAIIATMVLGGGPLERPPDADLVYSEHDDGSVSIAIASVDGLTEANTEVRLQGGDTCDVWTGSDDLEVGDAVTVAVDGCGTPLQEGDVLQVIWTSGSQGLVIDSYEIRDGQFDDPYFLVEITDTNAPVTEGETLEVTVEIENVGGETGTQDVVLEIRDGETVVVDEGESKTLDEGMEETITLEWETSDGDAGDYLLEVRSDDDSDTEDVTVEELEGAAFDVMNFDGPDSGQIGQVVEASATIENTGEAEGTRTVEYTFAGEVVDTEDVTLGGGEQTTVEFAYQLGDSPHPGLTPGEFNHQIAVDTGSEGGTIDVALGINFQPPSGTGSEHDSSYDGADESPDGYIPDFGFEYGERGFERGETHGYQYGWVDASGGVDNSEATRNRQDEQNPVSVEETLIHFGESASEWNDGDPYWTIDLPDGEYEVELRAGDTAYSDQELSFVVNDVTFEDQVFEDGHRDPSSTTYQDVVEVTDGSLTIRPLDGTDNPKIKYVIIEKA